MNRTALIQLCTFGAVALLAGQCAQSGPDSSGTGGATGSGTGGATGEAGKTGAGGSGTGGSTGTAGATGMGGSTSGTGGSTGAGGRGTGGATGSGGAALVINDIVPGLDGFYWEASPSGNTALSGTNYPFGDPGGGACTQTGTWATSGYIANKMLTVGGTAGQRYTVNINVRGVAGTRCYTGGTPASTAVPSETGPNNTWYVGGAQFNNSIWNTYEIHVNPPVPNAANLYFANAFPNTGTWCQREATYEVRYNASFPVMGGGTITFTIHDTNCRTLGNCGASANTTNVCDPTLARTIDMSGVSPAATNFGQPRAVSLGGTNYFVQWLWIDVTSVTSP
jgi:hypothetical protein